MQATSKKKLKEEFTTELHTKSAKGPWVPRSGLRDWAGWSRSVCMDGQKEGRVGGWTDEWVGFGLIVH